MAGFTVDAGTINNRAGSLVVQLRQDLDAIKQFNAWLTDAATTDGYLQGVGVSAADITALRASFTDLMSLYNVSHGVSSTGVNDFFFNARHLTGVV